MTAGKRKMCNEQMARKPQPERMGKDKRNCLKNKSIMINTNWFDQVEIVCLLQAI